MLPLIQLGKREIDDATTEVAKVILEVAIQIVGIAL